MTLKNKENHAISKIAISQREKDCEKFGRSVSILRVGRMGSMRDSPRKRVSHTLEIKCIRLRKEKGCRGVCCCGKVSNCWVRAAGNECLIRRCVAKESSSRLFPFIHFFIFIHYMRIYPKPKCLPSFSSLWSNSKALKEKLYWEALKWYKYKCFHFHFIECKATFIISYFIFILPIFFKISFYQMKRSYFRALMNAKLHRHFIEFLI